MKKDKVPDLGCAIIPKDDPVRNNCPNSPWVCSTCGNQIPANIPYCAHAHYLEERDDE